MSDFLFDFSSSIWMAMIPIFIGITGAALAIINYKYNKKRDKFNSLFEAFSYLNEGKHREARRVLYYKTEEKVPVDLRASSQLILGYDATSIKNGEKELLRVCKDIVRDDMNHMGSMAKSKLLPEKEFLERYWKTIVDCRWLLRYEIEERRYLRDYSRYVIDFDYLTDRACEYAIEENVISDRWKYRCNYTLKEDQIHYNISGESSAEHKSYISDKPHGGALGFLDRV